MKKSKNLDIFTTLSSDFLINKEHQISIKGGSKVEGLNFKEADVIEY